MAKKLNSEQQAKLDELAAARAAAKAAMDANPSPETREAYKAAWNAYEAYAFEVAPKRRAGFGSRAGQRQAAEREAMRKDALARAGRRW